MKKINIVEKTVISVILMTLLLLLINNTSFAKSTSSTAKTTKTATTSTKSTSNTTSTNKVSNNTVSNSTASDEIEEKVSADQTISNLIDSFQKKGVTKNNITEAITAYKEISKDHTNEEISKMIEDKKKELQSKNISTDKLDSITNVLENYDEDQLNTILDKVNVEDALNEAQAGTSLLDIAKKTASNMSTSDKIDVVSSLIWKSKVAKKIAIALIALAVYKILVRCVIYKKAHKHAWAILVPIYRDVVMLKICGMSPWWLLLLFVPVIGWALLWVVSVASRFMLAEGFDKNPGFGFGLWLLWPIFESILAFNKKTKYVGIVK